MESARKTDVFATIYAGEPIFQTTSCSLCDLSLKRLLSAETSEANTNIEYALGLQRENVWKRQF
jgi:hypothetical protein